MTKYQELLSRLNPRNTAAAYGALRMEAVAAIENLSSDLAEERAQSDRLAAALEDLLAAYAEPDRALCCAGASNQCGCMGATAWQEAEYYAKEAVCAALKNRKART